VDIQKALKKQIARRRDSPATKKLIEQKVHEALKKKPNITKELLEKMIKEMTVPRKNTIDVEADVERLEDETLEMRSLKEPTPLMYAEVLDIVANIIQAKGDASSNVTLLAAIRIYIDLKKRFRDLPKWKEMKITQSKGQWKAEYVSRVKGTPNIKMELVNWDTLPSIKVNIDDVNGKRVYNKTHKINAK